MTRTPQEMVVLLDPEGRPSGVAAKRTVHHAATPLHLAFSCWLFDTRGQTLLTQRAAHKRTWPGVWSNSFCGHPAPDESLDDAVRRRARDELGAAITEPEPVLPDFRYTAAMADGTMENEVCPVYVAELVGAIELNPLELSDARWIGYRELAAEVRRDPATFSPWLALQLAALDRAGWDPRLDPFTDAE